MDRRAFLGKAAGVAAATTVAPGIVLYTTALYERNIKNWRGEFYALLLYI